MRWRSVRNVTLIIFGVGFGLPASCVAAFVFLFSVADWDRYDRNNPNYQLIASLVREEVGLPGQPGFKRAPLELDRLNGGDWQFLCVIGGYNDPVKILRDEAARRGVTLSQVDPVKTQFLGLHPVEEDEGAISFVDEAGRGITILIDGFERLAGQHDKRCFGRETKVIFLPISDSRGETRIGSD